MSYGEPVCVGERNQEIDQSFVHGRVLVGLVMAHADVLGIFGQDVAVLELLRGVDARVADAQIVQLEKKGNISNS